MRVIVYETVILPSGEHLDLRMRGEIAQLYSRRAESVLVSGSPAKVRRYLDRCKNAGHVEASETVDYWPLATLDQTT